MEYVTLNNGVQLPMIGFGTWDVRGEAGKKTILTALDSGYRLIDTAQMYENEDIVGQAVKESGLERKEVFLTTKLYRPCVTYEKAKAAIEKSLQALQKEMEKHGTQMQSWASFTEGRKNIFAEPLLQDLGNKYGKTSAQIALRYLVQNKIAVIPKSVHQERMKQNLAVFDFEISQEDMKKIEKLDGGKTLFGWY